MLFAGWCLLCVVRCVCVGQLVIFVGWLLRRIKSCVSCNVLSVVLLVGCCSLRVVVCSLFVDGCLQFVLTC